MINVKYKFLNTFSNVVFLSYSCSYPNCLKYFNLFIPKNRSINNNINQVIRLKHQLKPRLSYLLVSSLPFLNSGAKKELGSKSFRKESDLKSMFQEADELFDSNKYQEAVTALLPHKESKNVEVLWRLSRALYKQSQSSSVPEAKKRELIDEAYALLSEALNEDSSHYAVHKWMGVLLDAHSAYDGIKTRITQLENVKNHFLKAVELNPNDATTHYMLGSWCYQIADMAWYQRKVAAAIFAAPPTSSYEEALEFFSKGEEISPKFYSQNLLMLGKTLLKLKRPADAKPYLIQAKDYEGSSEEDTLVKKEAAELLKTIK